MCENKLKQPLKSEGRSVAYFKENFINSQNSTLIELVLEICKRNNYLNLVLKINIIWKLSKKF